MTLHVFRHISYPDHRESIERTGLKPHRPADGGRWSYVPGIEDQPTGVYVGHAHDNSGWWSDSCTDVWEFVYVGPLLEDKLIAAAFVVPEHVPADALTLVAHA